MRKRKNAFTLDFFGASDLIKKIEATGGDIEQEVSKAVARSMESPKKDLLTFIKAHHYSGVSEKSFGETPFEWKNGRLDYAVGFNLRKGGLGALYLDVGTPKQTPTYFVYNTTMKNLSKIRDAQQQALQEIFKEF